MANDNITVKELIDSLSKFNPDDPVRIVINQYNKVYPVAYCKPKKGRAMDFYAHKIDGTHVSIECTLPHDEEGYMYTATRKK